VVLNEAKREVRKMGGDFLEHVRILAE